MQDVQIMVRVVNRASAQLQQVAKDAERMGHSFKASQIAFQYLQFQAFAGLMAIQVGLMASVQAGFEFNSQMELMLMRWTNITGSATEGQAMVDMMREIVKETSLTTEQISSFANRLLQAGIPIDQLETKLMGLANIQAKYGLSNEEAQRFVLGFTQALSKGKLQAEEMNQMLEAGVPIYQILQDEFGWTKEQVHGLGRDSERTAEALAFLNGEFLEGTQYIDDYAQTMTGTVNRFKDAWVAFSGALQEDIFQSLKGYIQGFSGYLERVTEDIRGGSSVIDAVMNNMSQSIREKLTIIKNAFMVFFAYSIGTKLATMAIQFGALAQKIGGFAAMFAKINPMLLGISVAIGVVVLAVMKLVEWYNTLNSKYPELATAFGAVKQLLADLGAIIMSVIQPALKAMGLGFDENSEKANIVMFAFKTLVVVIGAVSIVIALLADVVMSLVGFLKILGSTILFIAEMMYILSTAVRDPIGAFNQAKDAWGRYKDNMASGASDIEKIFSKDGFTARVTGAVNEAVEAVSGASEDMNARISSNMNDILTNTNTSVNGQVRAYERQKQSAQNASTTVKTASNTAGMAVLKAGQQAQQGGSQVASGVQKGATGAQQGASKVQQAGKTVGNAVLDMGRQAQAHAPKVGQAVGKASTDAKREADKLPPQLRTAGSNATKSFASGIESNRGAVRASAQSAGNAGGDFLKNLNWSAFGRSVISTFASGISAKANVVRNAVSAVVGLARKLLPSSDAKEGALSDLTYSGQALVGTVANGVYKNASALAKATGYVAQQARNSLNTELGAQMFGQQQYLTVYHVHQGQVDVVGDNNNQNATNFVGQEIGYEGGTSGYRTVIRQNGGGRF